ncbi:MAG: glycerol-3-phosphate dehydrogenase/oxidase [Pseudomonadota bacterium]
MQKDLKRVRVAIIGGGIHGAGILHDLTSRGWKDVILLEKNRIGVGTSSRSTKLVHGGLRYLQRISQFGMVRESLKERKTLMDIVPDIVKPIELVLPILKKGGRNRFMIKAGLTLYDTLAGSYHLERHRGLSTAEAKAKIPCLNAEKINCAFSFYDGQMDDLALVRRVAASGRFLGGELVEGATVTSVNKDQDGWIVDYTDESGKAQHLKALVVINAAGPWAHEVLHQSNLIPTHRAINNQGSHLIFPDMGIKSGLFLESPRDGRIFFLTPWQGVTLLGTTEKLWSESPNDVKISEEEIDYLLNGCNEYLDPKLRKENIIQTFSGLRWLAVDQGQSISSTSREHSLGYHYSGRGFFITIYGGKYTSYRSLCEKIGDEITKSFGEFRDTRTHEPEAWIPSHLLEQTLDPVQRFEYKDWRQI